MSEVLSRSPSGIASLPYPDRFHAAAEYVGISEKDGNTHIPLSDETSLLLYALYMQATAGPCNTSKPWAWKSVDQAKWSSWNQLGMMPSVEAMRLFVRTLEEEDPHWFSKTQQGRAAQAPSEMPVQDCDLNPSSPEEDAPVVNTSPSSPPANGGSIDVRTGEKNVECSIVKEINLYNEWVSPAVSGRLPTARYQHSAAVVGHKMFIVGGNHNGRYLNDVQVLDLRSLTWTKAENQNVGLLPCAGHSLICRNNMLFSVGGHSKNSSETVTVHALDTETLRWSVLPTYGQAPVARRGQSVCLVGSSLIMFGGEDKKRRLLNDLNIFDLETMTWEAVSPVGPPPAPRADHTAGVYAGRFIYIFGGGSHSTCFNDLHVLDLESMEWCRKDTTGVTARAGHASAAIGDLWYIVGGGDNKSGVSETVVLNMATFEWSTVTSVPLRTYIACEGLSLVSALLNEEETLIAFGGYNGRYSNETHVLKTGMTQVKVLPPPSFGGNHVSEIQDDASEKSVVSKRSTQGDENGGLYDVTLLLELKREQETALAAAREEIVKLSHTAADLTKELHSVRGQLVTEQTRCFKLEVDVSELRQKLHSMEDLRKELDTLRKEKAASDEAMAAAMAAQRQKSGMWGWIAGAPSDAE